MSEFAPVLVALVLTLAPLQGAEITTIAGTGKAGYGGDGGPALSGMLNNPYGMTFGPDGALYFCEVDNHVIRRLDLKTHRLSTVAGNGHKGYSGDGGPATQASLSAPHDARFGREGNLL